MHVSPLEAGKTGVPPVQRPETAPLFADELQQRPGLIDDIIAVVRERTGIDFSLYRRATIQRRIGNRMIIAGADSYQSYLERLQSDHNEAWLLLERLTIKVSRFYRNAHSFDFLHRTVIPALTQRRKGAPLRIWSAGCGCGEEAYTFAMLLEAAGVEGYVEATDIDAASLATAGKGIYRSEQLVELPSTLARSYLRAVPGAAGRRYEVTPALRQRVRFSLHDITGSTAPPGEGGFDLVSCRNVLIYLRPDAQRSAFGVLRHALAPEGYLFIGEAEWPLPEVAAAFQPLAHKTQVFRYLASEGKGNDQVR